MKMETTGITVVFWDYRVYILGLYKDDGKEMETTIMGSTGFRA